MSSPLEFLDQQEAERAKELKKLAQTPCYDHTQCGEDCLPDCPHYAEGKVKPAYTKEPWRVGNYHCCVVSDTPIDGVDSESSVEYYGGHCICESCTDANADRIVACVNACKDITNEQLEKFTINPYVHDLEQRIELLEMQLEETQAKADAYDSLVSKTIMSDAELDAPLAQRILREMAEKAEAYDRLMSGGKVSTAKEAANFYGRPVASVDREWKVFENLPEYDGYRWWDMKSRAFLSGETVEFNIDAFEGDEETSLTLPDGWEEK